MTCSRLDISQEALVWRAAFSHLGSAGFHQALLEIWNGAGLPTRATVEYLDKHSVGDAVLSIVRAVQIAVGALVPYRDPSPDRLVLYSRHAQVLADGLLLRVPVKVLPQALKGIRLEMQLGL
jgi:hypothetical protein